MEAIAEALDANGAKVVDTKTGNEIILIGYGDEGESHDKIWHEFAVQCDGKMHFYQGTDEIWAINHFIKGGRDEEDIVQGQVASG